MVEVNRTTSGVTRIVRCATERDPSTPNIGLASAHRGARVLGFPPLDIVPLRSVVPRLALGAYKIFRPHPQLRGHSAARAGTLKFLPPARTVPGHSADTPGRLRDKLRGDLTPGGPLRPSRGTTDL